MHKSGGQRRYHRNDRPAHGTDARDGCRQFSARADTQLCLIHESQDAFAKGGDRLQSFAHARGQLADHHQHRTDGGSGGRDLDDRIPCALIHLLELLHKCLDVGHDIPDGGHQGAADLDHQLLQGGFQNGDLSGKVVLHGRRYLLRAAVAVVNGAGQLIEILIRGIDDRKPARHGVFAENGGCCRSLLCLGQRTHLFTQGDHSVPEIDGTVRVCYQRDAILVHVGLHLLGGLGKVGKACAQRRTGLGRLDTGVCHQTQGDGGTKRNPGSVRASVLFLCETIWSSTPSTQRPRRFLSQGSCTAQGISPASWKKRPNGNDKALRSYYAAGELFSSESVIIVLGCQVPVSGMPKAAITLSTSVIRFSKKAVNCVMLSFPRSWALRLSVSGFFPENSCL